MLRKVFNLAGCLLIVGSPAILRGQGADAQDVTQSIFDQHKEADPTNSERALTHKVRPSEVHIEQVPLPSRPPSKTVKEKKILKQVHDLRQQKKDFIAKQIQEEKKKMAATVKFAKLGGFRIAKQANGAWENTEAGRTLRKLETEEKTEAKVREKTEARISTVPLPSRSN